MRRVLVMSSLAVVQAAVWTDLPPLPMALSGQFVGVSHRALLVAGGSRFDRPPSEGGTKQWVDTLYVSTGEHAAWQPFHIDTPLAYGGSATWRDSFLLVGGGDARTHTARVRRLEWDGARPVATELPALPHALAFCAATVWKDELYVAGGIDAPAATSASTNVYALDLVHPNKGWRTLETLPAPGRILPVLGAVGDALYVFGGATLERDADGAVTRRYLRDGWRWQPGHGWTPAPAPPHAMVAAPRASIDATKLVVFGGDDGALAAHGTSLGDKHPGFARDVYVFDAERQSWSVVSKLPVGLVTTGASMWKGRVIIAGGEDRPGHRSARVLSWNLQ